MNDINVDPLLWSSSLLTTLPGTDTRKCLGIAGWGPCVGREREDCESRRMQCS